MPRQFAPAAFRLVPGVYHSLRIGWRSPRAFATDARLSCVRNTILGRRLEGRRFEFVFLATLIAGFWSLMSGLVLVMTLQACGFLLA